jgi:hypothetical protein
MRDYHGNFEGGQSVGSYPREEELHDGSGRFHNAATQQNQSFFRKPKNEHGNFSAYQFGLGEAMSPADAS